MYIYSHIRGKESQMNKRVVSCCILAIVTLVFSISCAALMTEYVYDIPVVKLYKYIDKSVCVYPSSKLDPSTHESLFRKPASMYLSPQFKSVTIAADPQEAKDIPADLYFQIAIRISHVPKVRTEPGSTNAFLDVRSYDANWKLIFADTYGANGKALPTHGPQEQEEAVYGAMNRMAQEITKKF